MLLRLAASTVGALVGSAATFLYCNLDPFERMVADVDGFPRWYIGSLIFTLPEALVGAGLGLAFAVTWQHFREWRASKTDVVTRGSAAVSERDPQLPVGPLRSPFKRTLRRRGKA